LEKTSEIIQPNGQPITTTPAKPCPKVPHPHIFWTPKCHFHTFFEPLQGWGLHHLPGYPGPLFHPEDLVGSQLPLRSPLRGGSSRLRACHRRGLPLGSHPERAAPRPGSQPEAGTLNLRGEPMGHLGKNLGCPRVRVEIMGDWRAKRTICWLNLQFLLGAQAAEEAPGDRIPGAAAVPKWRRD